MSEENKKEVENIKPEEAVIASEASQSSETKAEAVVIASSDATLATGSASQSNAEEIKAEETVIASEEKQSPKAEPEAREIKTDGTPMKPSAKADAKPEARSEDTRGQQGPGGRPGQGGGRGPGAPRGKGGGGQGGGSHKKRSRHEEPPSEFIEKVVQVRRVTKVVKGGKKLSFRTTVIIGNEKGKVGVGVGKAAEVLIAIKKAIADARKSLVDISTVAGTNTISHTVRGIAGGSNVLLKPAAEGTGIIAGGTARIVLELAGVGDILAKSQGSKSPLNVARATVNALGQLRSFQEVAELRGISKKKMLFA